MNDIVSVINNTNGTAATGVSYASIPGVDSIVKDKIYKSTTLSYINSKLIMGGINLALLSFLHYIIDNNSKLTFASFKDNSTLRNTIINKTKFSFTEIDQINAGLDIATLKKNNASVLFDKKKLLSIVLLFNNIDDVSSTVDISAKSNLTNNMILVNALFKALNKTVVIDSNAIGIITTAVALTNVASIPVDAMQSMYLDNKINLRNKFENDLISGRATR